MIVKDGRSPKGRPMGPRRARLSYTQRGSIPANVLGNVIPPASGGASQAIGPTGPTWRETKDGLFEGRAA